MYKIMLIIGIIGSLITFITTIILFFKCNVIEIVKDLTGIKIVKKNEVILASSTSTGLSKIKSSISRNTNTLKLGSSNKEKFENKDIIRESKSNDKYIAHNLEANKESKLLDKETDLLDEETGLLEEETNILDEETGLLEEETNVLDEETGLLDEDTNLLEEVLKDGEYIKELDVVIVNHTSIIKL